MRAYKDTKGRMWELTIDPLTIKRVKGLVGVNLYGLIEDEGRPLGELLKDPARLVDVVYVLCKDQCDKQNVSDEEFGRSFDGDVLEAMADAFMEELIDFFPKRVRASLRALSAKGKALGEALLTKAEAQLQALDPDKEADRMMELFEQMNSRSWSGNSSASLSVAPTEP